ncbi:MAG: ribonuclease HI [Rectinemataceae bacterium]
MDFIDIHTDGGCSGNPGPGGWAYVMRYRDRVREDSGAESDTTNNRMELRAVIEALRFMGTRRAEGGLRGATWADAPLRVFTDSQYVRNGVTKWISGWKRNGWKTADKKPVKNRELWEELDVLAAASGAEFHWVEGHSGVPDNERCDDLVQLRIAELKK